MEQRKKNNWKLALVMVIVLAVAMSLVAIFLARRARLPDGESEQEQGAELTQADESPEALALEKLRAAEVGDLITFGTYEQDNNSENGKEEITWRVLDRGPDRILVISETALDTMPFYSKYTVAIWRTSTLRRWLNSSFLNEAFSTEEIARISKVSVPADKNPGYDIDPGEDTEDQVFLLSIPEVLRYLPSEEERQCWPSDYAVARGCAVEEENGTCWWWLRSPGRNKSHAAYVFRSGAISENGHHVDQGDVAVRPALWLDLSP